MDRLDGLPVARADAIVDRLDLDRGALARELLDVLVRQITVGGVFHSDPHGGNILVLSDGRLGLLDFGSVGRLDATLQQALERLLLALDRGDALGASDALLELVPRPDEIDQAMLERDIGRFLARYGPGIGVSGARMFADLFRIVTDHGLSIPPEVAAVFRMFATIEGTLTSLDPGFDLITETKALATRQFTERLEPEALRASAVDELTALLPVLRRLPRRLDHIASAAEHGRLGMNVRLLADERDRSVITDWLHDVGDHGCPAHRHVRWATGDVGGVAVRAARLQPADDQRDPRPARPRAGLPAILSDPAAHDSGRVTRHVSERKVIEIARRAQGGFPWTQSNRPTARQLC